MRVKLLAILIVVILGITFSSNKTFAHPPFLKQTKDLGFEAKDCTYCHEKSAGGKGWNKRGLWLKDQKKERKASQVDVRWLKSYSDTTTDKKEEPKDDAAKSTPLSN